MEILKTINDAQEYVLNQRRNGLKIGFVPTMGALHQGHISLVEKSTTQNDITIVSIFVNPTQFNNAADLEKYPRTIDADCKMLEAAGCNMVFTPDEKEMYPQKDERVFSFNGLESCLEGEFRPGHFNGVAQIVSKLFFAIPAHNAYFGQKDFQQLAVIKQLVLQLDIPVNIIPCPTIRESDGLAMSSRNLRLTPEHRSNSTFIYKMLQKTVELAKANNPTLIKEIIISEFNKNKLLKLEYFDIVDNTYLQQTDFFQKDTIYIACVAVWAGDVRLIDNIQIN